MEGFHCLGPLFIFIFIFGRMKIRAIFCRVFGRGLLGLVGCGDIVIIVDLKAIVNLGHMVCCFVWETSMLFDEK